jgi:hypothetical protein
VVGRQHAGLPELRVAVERHASIARYVTRTGEANRSICSFGYGRARRPADEAAVSGHGQRPIAGQLPAPARGLSANPRHWTEK